MMPSLRIALAQINAIVGDHAGNARIVVGYMEQARRVGADLILFPGLAVTGYPPEDLLLNPALIRANRASLAQITSATQGLTAVVGRADVDGDVHNAAAVIHDGALPYCTERGTGDT